MVWRGSEVMQAGASKPAAEVIRTLTRGASTRISPDALVRYFRPLELWLRAQNREEQLIGWSADESDVRLFSPLTAKAPSTSPPSAPLLLLLTAPLTLRLLLRSE
ncbi:unnamed protein product, partial [Iphiclides podalirius]